jgi:hypothetical protein
MRLFGELVGCLFWCILLIGVLVVLASTFL